MHVLFNRKPILWLLPFALLMAGCLEVEQEITIEKRNRGTFRIAISIPVHVYEKYAKDEKAPLLAARFFDPEKGSRWFNDTPGIKLTRYKVFNEKDRSYVWIEGKITDVKKAFASGRLGKFKLTSKPDKSQRLELMMEQPKNFRASPEMTKLTAGSRFELKIKVPGKLTASSGKNESSAAFWSFDASKNADFLKKPPSIYVEYK